MRKAECGCHLHKGGGAYGRTSVITDSNFTFLCTCCSNHNRICLNYNNSCTYEQITIKKHILLDRLMCF